MKRVILLTAILSLAALACGLVTPTPTFDIHTVETFAAATLTAIAPTQSPPTLIAIPSLTPLPSATSFPTLPPPGSSPTRIQFRPGDVSATISDTVTFPNRPQFLLYAFKGQRTTIQIVSPGNAANFALAGVSDGQFLKRMENEERSWSGFLPLTQDYVVTVAVPSGSVDFTLIVTIIWQ